MQLTRSLCHSIVLLAFVCLCVSPTSALNLYVPSQYGTIQAAINVSHNGDFVIVADGTYSGPGNVDLDFLGNNITVRSASGDALRAIIDCQGNSSANHRGFVFQNGETGAVIQGLTIENGYQNYGGAVYVRSGSAVTLTNCVIS